MSRYNVKTKEDLVKHYEKCLEYMVSDSDFSRWLDDSNGKILRYADLKGYGSIEPLLPGEIDYKIILTEWKRNTGHWCCLLRYGKTIEWFDPLGGMPDSELSFVPEWLRAKLGEDKRILSSLLRDAKAKGFTVIYNKKKLQQDKDGIDTCGRHTLARIMMLKVKHFNLEQYLDFLERQSKQTEKPFDILICDLIPME